VESVRNAIQFVERHLKCSGVRAAMKHRSRLRGEGARSQWPPKVQMAFAGGADADLCRAELNRWSGRRRLDATGMPAFGNARIREQREGPHESQHWLNTPWPRRIRIGWMVLSTATFYQPRNSKPPPGAHGMCKSGRAAGCDPRRPFGDRTSCVVTCRVVHPSLTPSLPARSCTYCQATRPDRAPRVVAHSSASRRSVAASVGTR
jgi:hypothetical protein